MGIPDLPEKDLLGVVSCKTTKSRNKLLHFRYEPEGTVFFVRKKGEEYIFSKKPDKQAEKAVIKRNTYPNFLYIPVKQIISEEGDVSIYRKGKDYIVKPATERDILLKKKGKYGCHTLAQLASLNGIRLSAMERKTLYRTGYLKIHIVSGNGKLYAEISPCRPEEELPSMTKVASRYGGIEHLGLAEEYTYKRAIPSVGTTVFPLPISFLRKTGMKNGDAFHTYYRKDGTLVIEPKPLVCEACGKKIDRYKDTSHEVTVCKTCSKTVPVIRTAKRQGTSYGDLIREVRELKDQLTQLQGGFQHESK